MLMQLEILSTKDQNNSTNRITWYIGTDDINQKCVLVHLTMVSFRRQKGTAL